LKILLTATYVNNLYIEDAVRLEINSRTYLERVAITNETAEYLVENLRPLVSGSANNGIIRAIYYPKGSSSMGNYTQQMRHATDAFKPGYGCLFTVEFEAVDVAARFYDNLDLHKGPSLGADVTLALPYVQMVLQREKEWAAGHGLRETIVRFSVGLEDKHDLLRRLKAALAASVR
jgi:cystathionine gamma-synthase